MPHCPDCGLWVHPVDPACLACDAELEVDETGDHDYDDYEGLMADEVTRGRLQTEFSMTEFGFSFAMQRGRHPILISSLLLAISWLVLPLFALLGYAATTGQYAAQGRDTIPEMVDITSFLGDGLRVFLSCFLVFWLPIATYLYLANFYLVEPTHRLIIAGFDVEFTTDPVGVVAVYLIGLIALLIWPAILTLYTGTFNVAKTYKPQLLLKYMRSLHHLKSIAAVFILGFLFAFFVGFMVVVILAIDFYLAIELSPIGLVGGILAIAPLAVAILATAYGLLVIFATLGHIYYHASEMVVVPPAER